MTLLTRYLLRLHLVPFLFALSSLTSILLLNQIAKRFGSLVGKGLEWTVIAEFFALSIPFLVAMTIPMAVLVTVLFTISRLAADHEITALKAAGVSVYRLTRILVMASVGTAIVAFLFSDHILPRTNHRLRTLMSDIDRKKPTLAVKEQVINDILR
ncbi:MAG: LptF/LptG family permease, partial [Gemmatimonadetes bacterium]|nr:LptF/LptG family permease [Gemmatimonadota bacterium]